MQEPHTSAHGDPIQQRLRRPSTTPRTFLSEYGEPLPFTLMTTSHNEKTPKEALWFAFYNAVLPDDLDDELNAVVIVVDSDSPAAACKAWVTENQE